jgi:hypothetical protein
MLSRRMETVVIILLLAIGASVVFVLINAGLYIHEGTRQLQRSDIKLDTMLERHAKVMKDHERHEQEQARESMRIQLSFEAMLERQNRIWHALTER